MNVKYPYSKELKKPIHVDYDIGELIETGKLNKASAIFRRMTAGYRTKRALMSAGCFASEDKTPVRYYEFKPKVPKKTYPAMIYYHGGGFMFPIQKAMMDNSALYAENCGVKVFLPDYRIAPEATCREIMEDCYAMLQYVFTHAEELQVDTERVIIYGDSAGGCLAASTAILNQKRDHFPLRGQMLIYPVCDNQSEKYPSVKEYEYAVWNRKSNISMWKNYLSNVPNAENEYVPIKNICPGLPRAYVEASEMDILRDEAIAYAGRLKRAGVPVECNLVGGTFHGYDSQLKSPLVQRVFQHRYKVIQDLLSD